MKTPATPPDEAERLDVVQELAVMGTEGEERFDAITRIAKRLFDVPMALVTVIERDHQWFKSNQGMPTDQTPRHVSFCGHAILSDCPLVIPDTHADERFADNPLVTGNPGIRFYAGVPLRVHERRVGTLCILDRKPRHLSVEQRDSLVDLAGIVVREMTSTEMAVIDHLTGLANRRGFLMFAQEALHVADRDEIPATLLFFDVDELKAINDEYGHPAGDATIRQVAAAMKNTFRAADILARLAGDEFVALLHNTSAEQASFSVERLRINLSDSSDHGAVKSVPTLAWGQVTYDPARHPNIDSLIAEGDARMYEHKRDRRGRSAKYD